MPGPKVMSLIRYPLFVTVIGFISIFLSGTLSFENDFQWGVFLVGLLLIILFAFFPICLLNQKFTLLQVVPLGIIVFAGYFTAISSLLVGVIVGQIIYQRVRKKTWQSYPGKSWWLDTGFLLGSTLIPLSFVLTWRVGWWGGFLLPFMKETNWSNLIIPTIMFGAIHACVYILGFDFSHLQKDNKYRAELALLFLLEIALIPIIILSTVVFTQFGFQGIIVFWGTILLFSIISRAFYQLRSVVSRRVQELSILDQVSKTLRSTLELDELLPAIQYQITEILGVDNFYVALYDSESDEIWYPLAVKYGQRKEWGRRPMMDRLTDRVIRDSKPLLLTPMTQAGPNPIGLPPSEDTPASWLGVPLIVSDHAIGCLAVSELTTGIEFTENDIDLLTIISGQVSVAINNALLYTQAQIRANRLETINHLSGSISSSLKLQEVMAQVCKSVSIVVNAQRSAIYLLDHGGDTVHLSYAHGLSEKFISGDGKYSIAQNKRTRCLRTERPYIHPDIQSSTLDVEIVRLFRDEGIEAFADFPLISPDGALGFLSVFYNQIHVFHKEDINLLQTFASQAAFAVSNARLHEVTGEELSRRLHQLALIEAVGRELSAAIQSDNLFQLILEYALELTNADQGSVEIYNPETQQYRVEVSIRKKLKWDSIQPEGGVSEGSGRYQHEIFLGEFTSNPKLTTHVQASLPSKIQIPVRWKSRNLGVIKLESKEADAFEESDEVLVLQLANQAAIAMQNAQLLSDATNGRDRLSAILNSIREGIILVNTKGRIILLNEPVMEFTGVPISQLLHHNLSDLPKQALTALNYSKDEFLKLQTELNNGQIPTTQKSEHQIKRISSLLVMERETSPVFGSDGKAIG